MDFGAIEDPSSGNPEYAQVEDEKGENNRDAVPNPKPESCEPSVQLSMHRYCLNTRLTTLQLSSDSRSILTVRSLAKKAQYGPLQTQYTFERTVGWTPSVLSFSSSSVDLA